MTQQDGNGTVALAFSGGLDTTVCVPLLKEEYGYDDVIGVTVDVGQPDYEFDEAEETAEALGLDHYVVDAREAFADLCLQAVEANADYQGYRSGPLSHGRSSPRGSPMSPENRAVARSLTAVPGRATTSCASRPSGVTPTWTSSRRSANSA